MVMSQLLHFMQPEISKTYLFLTTTKEIQEAVMLSYSKKRIVDQLYDLKKQIAMPSRVIDQSQIILIFSKGFCRLFILSSNTYHFIFIFFPLRLFSFVVIIQDPFVQSFITSLVISPLFFSLLLILEPFLETIKEFWWVLA